MSNLGMCHSFEVCCTTWSCKDEAAAGIVTNELDPDSSINMDGHFMTAGFFIEREQTSWMSDALR